MARKLYRSETDRMISGVCGGLGKYFDIDSTIIRLITVLLALVTGIIPVLVAYIVMAIVIPQSSHVVRSVGDTVRENVEEMKSVATELGREISSELGGEEGEGATEDEIRHRRRNWVGIVLIVVGGVFLLGNLGTFWFRWSWLSWGTLWPLVIIGIGALIIWGTTRRR